MLTDEQIAQVAHETNRAYCEALGDTSQTQWDFAPEWQRKSAIEGVQFHRADPNATPEQSHENWMAKKKAEGWVYGPDKDARAKTHPCMMPYDSLPIEQRAKDYIFRGVVSTLLTF